MRYPPLFMLLGLAGCTGLSFGENNAGDDVYLETGSIAVDARDEVAYVLRSKVDQDTSQVLAKVLYAAHPTTGTVTTVADLTGYNDLRILFPVDSVLVMGEKDGVDELRRLSPGTFAEQQKQVTTAAYHGTRLAPGRRYLAVADNIPESAPIHIIDTTTFATAEIPHDGEWLEAMWLNSSDELLAIIFYDMNTADARARLLRWSIADVATAGFAADTSSGLWPAPTLDVEIARAWGDYWFSFTWVGISPDDQYAVFPVMMRRTDGSGSDHELIVLDLLAGTTRQVPDARGPVGFTPDGSTIVSYRYVEEDGSTVPKLLMVDEATLTEEIVDIPFGGGVQYYITSGGGFVVIASNFGNEKLVLYDLDTQAVTELDGPTIGLWEFISRPQVGELWLVDEGLNKLDLSAATLTAVSIDWTPQHIAYLPERDRLVLDDASSNLLRWVSPDTLEVTLQAELPEPEPAQAPSP